MCEGGINVIEYYLPPMSRVDPIKQCGSKMKYDSIEHALEGCHAMAVKERSAGRDVVIRPYVCPYCRKLHVGRVKVI